MSAPLSPPQKGTWSDRLLRPAVILPAAAVALLVVVLFSPQNQDARSGDSRLTTYSTAPLGAQLFHDLAKRLGWSPVRWTDASMPAADSTTIVAELAPPNDPSEADAHALMQHVRAGGALLYVLGSDPIADSLRVRMGGAGRLARPALDVDDPERCGTGNDGAVTLWPGTDPYMASVRWQRGLRAPADMQVFSTRIANDSTAPTVIGFPLGRGRVVVFADPDMLRNDVLRVCHWRADLVAVRALEYLSAGGTAPRRRIVFDEYHQGYGLHPGTVGAVFVFLGRTVPGRVLAQILLGCVVLVFAVGARTVPPGEETAPERRSPLEHVDALGRAYEQAGATRTIVERLLRGIRRRAERSAVPSRRSTGDREFLDWVATRFPARREDVDLVSRALGAQLSRQELEHAGEALRRIEETLSTPSR